MIEWISVKDRMPEAYVDVITIRGDDRMVATAFLDEDGEVWRSQSYNQHGFLFTNATHWAPIPELPEKKPTVDDILEIINKRQNYYGYTYEPKDEQAVKKFIDIIIKQGKLFDIIKEKLECLKA